MTHHDDAAPLLCGTYAGYIRHVKTVGDQPCEDCRAAATLYHRLYRSRPGTRPREKRQTRARARALSRLARMYPTAYRALYAEELDALTPTEEPDHGQP